MILSNKLAALAEAGKPVRIGVIGAGKFVSMFLSQAPRTPGLHVVAVADLDVARARASLARVGWAADRSAATSLDEACRVGMTLVTDNTAALVAAGCVDVVVEATGNPATGGRVPGRRRRPHGLRQADARRDLPGGGWPTDRARARPDAAARCRRRPRGAVGGRELRRG